MRYVCLILALTALTGCAALKQALGLETAQDAPVDVQAGIAVFNMHPGTPGSDGKGVVTISFENIGNGDLGSSSDAESKAEQVQTVTVDPEAVGKAVGEVLPTPAPLPGE